MAGEARQIYGFFLSKSFCMARVVRRPVNHRPFVVDVARSCPVRNPESFMQPPTFGGSRSVLEFLYCIDFPLD